MRGIRDIGGLVLYDHVKIAPTASRKISVKMIDLAAGAYIHGVSVCGHIRGLRGLGFVIEFVGGQRAHEVHWGRQGDCLAVIQPGAVILRFRLEIAGALDEPCGVVPDACADFA